MEFPMWEYWCGLPFPSPGSPSPGNLPDPGIEPTSPALAGGFFSIEPPGKPCWLIVNYNISWTSVICQSVEFTKVESTALISTWLPIRMFWRDFFFNYRCLSSTLSDCNLWVYCVKLWIEIFREVQLPNYHCMAYLPFIMKMNGLHVFAGSNLF